MLTVTIRGRRAATLILALAALFAAAPSAWARAYFPIQCSEFMAFGGDHRSQCGDQIMLRARSMPTDPVESVTLSYANSEGTASANFMLELGRIETVGDADVTMSVVAMSVARRTPGAAPSWNQGPARGNCVVKTLDSGTQFTCQIDDTPGSTGPLRVSYPIPRPFVDLLLKEIREARFKLEAAALDGQKPVLAQAAAATPAPVAVNEKTCATEDDAKQAEAAATAGRPGADRLAAVCFARASIYAGPDRDRLFAKARQWFDRAIGHGDTDAMVALGLVGREVRMRGTWDAARNADVPPSQAELQRIQADTIGLFTDAAQRGNAAGQTQLCTHFAYTAGAQIDKGKAVSWCRKAADQGYGDAMYRLSMFYTRGEGVPSDPKHGRELLFQAADHGSIQALLDLARAYEIGASSWNPPIARDIGKALTYYRKIGTMPQKVAELEAAQGKLGAGVDATVFGIGVGFQLPSMMGCDAEADMRRLQPREPARNWCVDPLGTAVQRLGEALGLGRSAFADASLRLSLVKVNDATMDTSFLLAVLGSSVPIQVVTDRDAIVHYVSAETQITARDKVLTALTAKYGRPSRTSQDEWRNPRTGDLVRSTPVYLWDLKGVTVEFHTQDAHLITNTEVARGRIDVFTPTFANVLRRLRVHEEAAQPQRGGF